MADEKKPADKAGGSESDAFTELVTWGIVIFIGLYILNKLYVVINAIVTGDFSNPALSPISWLISFVISFVRFSQVFIIGVSIAGVVGVVLLYNKLVVLRTTERKLLYPEVPVKSGNKNAQWERILNHTESLNENDWRLSILEADIVLSGLLEKMFLPGDTIGEKLKAVEKSDFKTMDLAWEAHKIRNQIAHEGEAFQLNQREAKRVIDLYRQVFEEFQII